MSDTTADAPSAPPARPGVPPGGLARVRTPTAPPVTVTDARTLVDIRAMRAHPEDHCITSRQFTRFRNTRTALWLGVAAILILAVVSMFVGGPAQLTLPRQMFNGLRENISPTILAAAALLTLVSTLTMIATSRLSSRASRLQTG